MVLSQSSPQQPRATLPPQTEVLGGSPDGRFLATRRQGQVTLHDVQRGQVASELGGWPTGELTFSADGRWLASCSGEGRLKVWETSAGRERAAKS